MKQIIVSGFGGQGVLSLGLMLAYGAMHEGKNTSFLPSYGPEMRGGTANCSVVIAQSPIASPVISRPDVLVAFNEPSLARFLPALSENGVVFLPSDVPCAAKNAIRVPAEELCGDNPRGQNIVMLGAILSCVGLTPAAAEEGVRHVFMHKPQFIESNLRCLHAGLAFSRKAALV